MKKITALFLALILTLSFASCANQEAVEEDVRKLLDDVLSGTDAKTPSDTEAEIGEPQGVPGEMLVGFGSERLLSVRFTVTEDKNSVIRDEKFGAALIPVSEEEFEEIGFTLGDSLNIFFDNGGDGFEINDVPYYNGYYVKNGAPVVVAYPGDPYIRITLNNEGIWDKAGLHEGDSVTITLNESGKYLAIQEALGQVYSFDRTDYPSDTAFSNFRSLKGGNLKDDFLYRGASPVDNSRKRAPYTDALLKENSIKFVVDLADSEENIKGYMASSDFKSDYTKGLYNEGKVALLDMGSAYTSSEYMTKLAKGLRASLLSDGPVYIHCMEGKDRTGFVCMLLEALAGASYDEMLSDYMITYANYFGVTKNGTPEKYDAIEDLYFVPFMEFLHGTDDKNVLKTADFAADARNYLKKGGMTDSEIDSLVKLITK